MHGTSLDSTKHIIDMERRRFSAERSFEPYFIAGFLGAHSRSPEAGFRLRDAVFFINLATNWMESFIGEKVLGVTNIQVQRALNELVNEGYARKLSRGKFPMFGLTRAGLVECLQRLHAFKSRGRFDLFLFVYFLLRAYQLKFRELIKGASGRFPEPFRLELETLCDVTVLCVEQQQYLKAQLRKLEVRVRSARGIAALLETRPIDEELITEIETRFPYGLNSEEPMRNFLGSFAQQDIEWELKQGASFRTKLLWEPTKQLLEQQLSIVNQLIADSV